MIDGVSSFLLGEHFFLRNLGRGKLQALSADGCNLGCFYGRPKGFQLKNP